MRHNAAITVHFTEDGKKGSFNIFLSSYGTPSEIKLTIRKALRGMRRDLTYDPLRFVVNIIREARGEVTILYPTARSYLWLYAFNISEGSVPSLTINNTSGGTKETLNLFSFVGPERAISEKKPEPERKDYGKRRRGRPSGLEHLKSQGYLTPPPDHITPDGTPVFNITAKKHPLKINLRDAEKYAPKK